MTIDDIINGYLDDLNVKHEVKTLDDIAKVAYAHLHKYPFGNPKILLGETVPIDLEGVYHNLVVKNRGGYCFEHNKIMYEMLKYKGFDVSQHLARVVNNEAPSAPMTHRVTILYFEGKRYLVDVGVGFRSPTVPIQIGTHVEPVISHHLDVPYRVLPVDQDNHGLYTMQLEEKGKPYNATQFDLNQNVEADFQMSNFYSYKNPEGLWRNTLVLSLYGKENGEDVSYSLKNNQYFKIYKDHTDELEVSSLEQLKTIVRGDLNANYSDEELSQIYNEFVKNLDD